jgi:hypothetical protein
MLNALKDFIELYPHNVADPTFLSECLTFINNSGKLEASSGKNDDCVIANAIAVQMLLKEKSGCNWGNITENIVTIGGNSEQF